MRGETAALLGQKLHDRAGFAVGAGGEHIGLVLPFHFSPSPLRGGVQGWGCLLRNRPASR
jgi:hypothetical protein